MNELRKRKAISPVIATVILVAVAITISVAVAYWMAGIAGQYTQFEKVEIQSAYAVNKEGGGWTITLILKNSGTSSSTLTSCFINDKIIGVAPLDGVTCVGTGGTIPGTTGILIDSGKSDILKIETIPITFSSSGTTLNVELHSAKGMSYPRLIQLP